MEFIRIDPENDPTPTVLTDSDLAAQWVSSPRPSGQATPPRRRSHGTASSMLMAAMLGLADGFGFDRPRDDVVEVADAPIGGDDLQLDYGNLEPLDT